MTSRLDEMNRLIRNPAHSNSDQVTIWRKSMGPIIFTVPLLSPLMVLHGAEETIRSDGLPVRGLSRFCGDGPEEAPDRRLATRETRLIARSPR